MKSHPSKRYDFFHGVDLSYQADRIDDRSLASLWEAWCDPTGQIQKAYGYYPVTLADAFGVTTGDTARQKMWTMARFRGKDSKARALAILGSGAFMSVPNDIYDAWATIDFATNFKAAPVLDQACAIVFRNRFGYVQNITDLPWRVKMEEDDGSDPSWVAEPLGLIPPNSPFSDATTTGAGALFPINSRTAYLVTFVYGNNGERGESGPSLPGIVLASASAAGLDLDGLPLGPSGVTARRIYRTQIGRSSNKPGGTTATDDAFFNGPFAPEAFFLAEIPNNTTQTYQDTKPDSSLDFTRRVPPQRPMPPRSKYQIVHLDRIFWAHLREHPWVATVCTMEDQTGMTVNTATVTISNAGNGTITIVVDTTPNTFDATITVNDYKTKSLKTIRQAINNSYGTFASVGGFFGVTGTGVIFRTMAGVDDSRTYVFREVTLEPIAGGENTFPFEAIDSADAVDGCEYFRDRVMFSDLAFPEEINPFNQFEVAKDDAYPITNMQNDDFTLCVATQDKWWLIAGDFIPNELFVPNFSVSASRAEHGSLCSRPDACVSTPYGIFFISLAGLRLLRGGSDAPAGMEIDKLLMERLLTEPRTRDNPCMVFDSDTLAIAFPANVTV